MKRILFILLATVMALVSCDKQNARYKFLPNDQIPVPEPVDIGLVVGGHKVLWANFNLGASTEGGYGYYYAWGETKPKWKFTRLNYSYKANPDVLPADRDAASVVLGGGWRTPTREEFVALIQLQDNEDYLWEAGAVITEDLGTKALSTRTVKGLRITQKSTGNHIFIPYTEIADETVPGNNETYTFGFYMSSTLEKEDHESFYVFHLPMFHEDFWYWRHCGYTIRPVKVE